MAHIHADGSTSGSILRLLMLVFHLPAKQNVVWYEFVSSLTYCYDAHFDESNRSRIAVESKPNRSRIEVESQL